MPLTYDQTLFVVTLSCYIPTALLLWRSWVMKPFRLWTTFLHEFSHACAAWLCCHTVTGIEVHADEGGLTHWKGRNVECAKHAVLPAGYLGSTLWGCLILLSANDPFFARAMALALCAALFVCLGYAVCGQGSDKDGRFPLIFLSVGFIALLGGITVLCYMDLPSFTYCQQLLEAVLLWLGVLNMMNATIDIYDDTVKRAVDRSDAAQYAKLWGCCFAQCVGFTWLLLACGAFVGTFYASMLWAGTTNPSHQSDWTAFLPGPVVLGVACALQFFVPCLLGGAGSEGKPLLSV